ncbi:ABC transporter permease [Planomonospora algeriensis]
MTAVAAPTATPSAGFRGLVRAEWTKFHSVRSTMWSLLLLVVVTAGFSAALSAAIAVQWETNDATTRAMISADPTALFLSTSVSIGQFAVCVLGVMVIGSEYATGTIRSSLLAVPRRVPMLAAKALVLGLVTLLTGSAVSFGSFFLGAAVLRGAVPVSLDDPGVLRAVLGGGLYLSMLGLFALAVGAILRHTAGGITAVLGVVLVLPPLAGLLPGRIGDHAHAYLPSEAGRLITLAVPGDQALLTPWQGYGIFTAWTTLLLLAAAVLLDRRDA